MKKMVSILLVITLMINLVCISMGGKVKNVKDITVMIGNSDQNLTEASFPDSAPFITSGRVMVPLRFISEQWGATVNWNGNLMQANVKLRDLMLILVVGEKKILKIENGKEDIVNIGVEPVLVNGRIFVPTRFVESFGAKVDWDPSSYVVKIIDSDLISIPNPITYGGTIIVSSADVDIKVIFKDSDAGYNDVFGIYFPINRDLGKGHDTEEGTEFNLGKFTVGTELKFFIRNPNGNVFLNGPSSGNPDNLIHAKFQKIAENNWYLGFEDALGGGDGDCNDVELNIVGTVSDIPYVSPTSIPTIAPISTIAPTPTPMPNWMKKFYEDLKNRTAADDVN